MVIISNESGQLANRLILFAHFVANATEYRYQVANPSFHDYASYFPSLSNDFLCRYPGTDSRLKPNRTLQRAFFKLLRKGTSLYRGLRLGGPRCAVLDITPTDRGNQIFDLSSAPFIEARSATRYLFTKGWLFRDGANFGKHGETLRRFFTPAPEYLERIDLLMERARQDCDQLVGVHIRQGDYKKWLKGKHYYSSEAYAQLMRRYRDAAGERRVRFLICSNEPQDERLFAGLDYVMGNNHELEDLYSFARCDQLIGPPSTYTLWASFIGKVPLFVAESAEAPFRQESCVVFDG